MFNILSEEKIPFAREAFKHLGNVTLCKGNRLTAKDLKCIDILLIRSGTQVDQSLLEGTPVQFVASATAGTDHVDKAYLAEKNIPFFHAPGCNAESVVEYVIAAILALSERKKKVLRGETIGIVGVGQIGRRLVGRLKTLGLDILVNDPPLFAQRPAPTISAEIVSLEELLQRSDIVTLHTPLIATGKHPTFHLINAEQLSKMKPKAWLINASRGSVVNNGDLKTTLMHGYLGGVVLDVWEEEPVVDTGLMKHVDLATAHIAGHSYEGKVNGTIQIYESCIKHYGLERQWDAAKILAPGPQDHLNIPGEIFGNKAFTLQDVVRHMYDIEADDARFRRSIDMNATERGDYFLTLRKEYPRRRSFSRHTLRISHISPEMRQSLEKGIGIKISQE